MSLYKIRPDVVEARRIEEPGEMVLTDQGPQAAKGGQFYVTRYIDGIGVVGRLYDPDDFERAFAKIAD